MKVMPYRTTALAVVRRLARIFTPRRGAVLVGSLLVAWLICAAAPLRAAPLEPDVMISQFNDGLISAMKQSGKLGFRRRYNTLVGVVDATFDIALMTRMAVGPGWDTLPEDQQHRIGDGFRRFITAMFAERFDDYSGEKFEVGTKRTMGTGTLVANQMVTPSGERIQLNYLMHETPQGWRVVDVYLNGTISELAVHRSEFTAILKRSGAEGLIMALERKTQDLPAPG